jgi:polysaccharide biosynthesis/export protein
LEDFVIKSFWQNWANSILFTFCIFVFAANAAFAEQIQTVTLSPAIQETQSAKIQTETLKEQKGILASPINKSQPKAGLSLMEQYVSGVIEITDTQYEILKNNSNISFSYGAPLTRNGHVSILVRVLRRAESADKHDEVFAGYLTGSSDNMADAFKALGIKSYYAVTSGITQFGYDLFENASSVFVPSENVPVGPDYVVGPGDEIRITVWGKVEGEWNVVADRDGNIALPKVGILGITGLTFKELKELLYKEFSQYYSGFEMNVSMGSLRTIQIYVVGNAKSPGAYTISSLSTLVNSLFETGGPSKTGTMRDIQVKRNGDTVVHFDMYDFLLKGDKTKDIRLMPEDVIFIAPAGQHASIAGSVKTPAIYELKGDANVRDLIEMAGGLSDIAFSGRLQIERIVDKSRQTVFEEDLTHANEIKLQGGDVIKVFSVIDDRRTVRISGAVQREGEYGFSVGMTVKDLLSLSGGLRYYAFDEEAELTRVKITNEGPVTEKILINLKEVLRGKEGSDLTLMENDYLFVRTIPDWRLYRMASITGEVKFPGTYTIKKGELLSSLIERAGGFTKDAYVNGAIFTRESARARQQETIDEMAARLETELMGSGAENISTALSAEDAAAQKILIEQKRGFIKTLKALKAKGRVIVKLLPSDKLKGTSYDIALEEGDSINIPEDPMMVYTVGSVYNQASFIYDKKNSISDYIELSGGYTDNADKKKVYILKANGSAVRPGDGLSWNNSGLESGDSIIVPEKLEGIKWLKETKDITQILYQIAVSAGVLIVAF